MGRMKLGVKYLRFLYRLKRIWLGNYRVLETRCPIRAVSKLLGMGEPEHRSLTQSLAGKCSQHVLIYHKSSDRFQKATAPLVANYNPGKKNPE